jgi:hypothetical protein
MKRILIVIFALAAVGFGFDWGIYGGPGVSATLTNMKPMHEALSAYNIPNIAPYQVGLSTPLILRLWNFTLGGGNSCSWQTASGRDYKAAFRHEINLTEFGYIIDLSDHLRLRPVKARYLVPLETNASWNAEGTYDDVYVDGFYPHTPTVGINFFIGYEKVGEDRIEEGWEEE